MLTTEPSIQAMLDRRRRLLGSGPKLYYDVPFHPVRGQGVHLYDASGKQYLDAYNNVPHVGHCHPRVVDAICRQAALLNTNTRYLFDHVLDYAERLIETAPGLDTVLFTCTGSEANDLAGRLARAFTGARGVVTTHRGYHGNTTFLDSIDGSTIKSNPDSPDWWTTVSPPVAGMLVEGPDFDAAAAAYADEINTAIESLRVRGHGSSAFFFDTYFCADGVHPTRFGFMREAVRRFHAAGGIVVADEVQPGLARNGEYFWGFQQLGIAADIVTCGKPMGNGHPIGVLLTRREIAESFFGADRYFNTFAGNPVSSAAGLAVLDVIRDEDLQANAGRVGAELIDGLQQLGDRHEIVAAVRGAGFLIGVELVKNRQTMEPAGDETRRVINEMCRRGVLVGLTGPNRRARNVLKIRPPLVFRSEHAERLVATLDDVLASL